MQEYIPYGKQTVTNEDISEVIKVLKSPMITQGETVPLFEEQIKIWTGAKYGSCNEQRAHSTWLVLLQGLEKEIGFGLLHNLWHQQIAENIATLKLTLWILILKQV